MKFFQAYLAQLARWEADLICYTESDLRFLKRMRISPR